MRAFLYTDGKATELPFAEGAAHFGAADLVWLHLDGRTEATQTWVAQEPAIPNIVKTALLASETRPRCDVIGPGALVNLRGLGKTPEDDPDKLVSIRFWVEGGRVTTIGLHTSRAFDVVEARFLGGEIQDPGDLLAAFATAISDELDPDVAQLGDDLDDIETRLEAKGLFKLRRQVSSIRSTAIGYRRFVAPQRFALERLSTAPISCLDEDDRLHLRDASDRFARMTEELEAVRERAAIVHETLTDLRAEKIDMRSLVLSIAALVFLPLTFITGVFGMNFDVMPMVKDAYGFWEVIIFCLLISLGGIAWFIRNRWITRDDSID
jgi:zinc transporter